MNGRKNIWKKPDLLPDILYTGFYITVICAWRYESSLLLGSMLIAGVARNKKRTGNLFNNKLRNYFVICCAAYYLLQVISLSYTHDTAAALGRLRIMSGLIFIPITICCSDYPEGENFKKLIRNFILVNMAVMLACIVLAFIKYVQQNNIEVFFYHSLVGPFEQNAVAVSFLLFIGLAFLLEGIIRGEFIYNRAFHLFCIFYTICCLILLSSKLIILYTACYGAWLFFTALIKMKKHFLSVAVALLLCSAIFFTLFTKNPVSRRFSEIVSGDISLVNQKQFSTDIYFNGLQFRLLQWRFVNEILYEKNAWIKGVSSGDAQGLLDQKYISSKMYIGENNDGGFLGYNTHNQFLQSLLETGIIGLVGFMILCGCIILLAVKKKDTAFFSIMILLVLFAFNDSYLESQYGVVLFSFWPLFIYYGLGPKKN
jgi:O-antigen ligase